MTIGSLIIGTINLILIILVTYRVVAVDNDKSIVVFMFFYFVLIGLNFMLWAILSLLKRGHKTKMGTIIIGLVILFFPILIYLAQRE
jgi:tryptophan-rich sensory protein